MASRRKSRMRWYRADLHIHTPASADYMDKTVQYLDILRTAEQRGIDILGFTDHNTVNGYASMMREIEQLTYLADLGRAQPDELRVLAEYRRLLDKILVLPGFEFTATFGFHIIALFSPEASLRQIEHILLKLNIPPAAIEEGSSHVGASSDVLTAYQAINEGGGIVLAAHVNANHGVAMRGMDFGGQTRIAYTQNRFLHALEVTDLGKRGRSTQRFFDGTKPEYPRRMRCIQGSDSHHINTVREKNRVITFGIGERTTEVLLRERTFEALLEMLQSNDFSRSRPYNPNRKPEDFILAARDEGPSMVQAFHDSMTRKGGKLYNVIADVCAFANTNGGTVYIGLSVDKKKKPTGVPNAAQAVEELQSEISSVISPALDIEIDTHETAGATIIRVQVPLGEHRPYAIDNTRIYVRDEADTSMAIRDEVVNLVRQGIAFRAHANNPLAPEAAAVDLSEAHAEPDTLSLSTESSEDKDDRIKPPRTGVEIVGVETRNDARYYVMRDLRNGNVVKNVTKSSARRLWHYAIKQKESNPVRPEKVKWSGDIGLWRSYKKSGAIRYDLVQRENGGIRVYYGATESGLHGPWQQFLAPEDQ